MRVIFGRRRRLMANQVPAVEAAGILRLMVERGLVTRGEAAACLRGIANDLVAYGHRGGLGDAGRAYAAALLTRADELAAVERSRAPAPKETSADRVADTAVSSRPQLVWRS